MDKAKKNFMWYSGKLAGIFVAVVAVCSAILFGVLMNSGISLFLISGDSMEPYLHDGESVILKQERIINNNQIVFFTKPSYWNDYAVSTDHTLVKRVVAKPGDTISYNGETFNVNKKPVVNVKEENYQCDDSMVGYEHTLFPSEVFVVGDNHKVSLDSLRIFCDGEPEKSFIAKRLVRDYGHIIRRF